MSNAHQYSGITSSAVLPDLPFAFHFISSNTHSSKKKSNSLQCYSTDDGEIMLA